MFAFILMAKKITVIFPKLYRILSRKIKSYLSCLLRRPCSTHIFLCSLRVLSNASLTLLCRLSQD